MKYAVNPPYLLRKFYSQLIWNFSAKKKCVYLTFDDGPIPEITPFVLAQLKQFNAKATFFCIGQNVEKHPELFQRIKSEGHAVANHTFNHLDGWKTKNEVYLENVKLADKLIESKFFRPPYGRIKKSQIKFLTSSIARTQTPYKIIMWDVLSYDFDIKTSPQKCLANVTDYAKEGSIIVFHDSLKAKNNLEYSLPKTLKHFSDKGFAFDAIC